jgi:mannosyltransferase OCH1-like enzyme
MKKYNINWYLDKIFVVSLIKDIISEILTYEIILEKNFCRLLDRFMSNDIEFQQMVELPSFRQSFNEHISRESYKDRNLSLLFWRLLYVSNRKITHGNLEFIDFLFRENFLYQIKSPLNQSENEIDLKIFQYWDKVIVPDDVWSLISEFRRNFKPEHYKLFNDYSAREFIYNNHSKDVLDIYDNATHVASKSDLFRLAYLSIMNGIYVDADERYVGRLSNLINTSFRVFLTWSKGSPPCINNWFLVSKGGNEIFERMLELASMHCVFFKANATDANAWLKTGPGVTSLVILDEIALYGISDVVKSIVFAEENVYREVFNSVEDLAYRKFAESNWRLQKS